MGLALKCVSPTIGYVSSRLEVEGGWTSEASSNSTNQWMN